MSLRAFHIFFIAISILLAGGCSAWFFLNSASPTVGYCCAAVAVALIVYGISFVKKSGKIIP